MPELTGKISMLREIVLDTETTGLDARRGDRIIEIGCIELINRIPTEKTFHHYIHPEDRDVHPDAQAIHGISMDQLRDKPKFRDIAPAFVEFIGDSPLVIHNAAFDIGFINAEFQRLRQAAIGMDRVVDTLALAKRKYPGGPNSLDALCKRYSIDNSHRELHGALLDAQILLDVYLAMTGGQTALILTEASLEDESVVVEHEMPVRPLGELKVVLASDDELAAHERALAAIDKASGKKTLWRALDAPPALVANMN